MISTVKTAPPITARATDTGRLAQAVALAAATLSTVLSGMGIHDALATVVMPEPLRIGVSAVLTFMVSALIFLLMRRAGRARASHRFRDVLHRPRMSVLLPLAGGLTMVLVSVSTSFSAMVLLKSGAAVQAEVTARQMTIVAEPLTALVRGSAAIAAEAAAVADLALAQSAAESARGGTCSRSGAGEGPVARMRAEHAQQLTGLRGEAEQLSKSASEILARVAQVRSQAEVDAAFAAAQGLALDPARARITRTASTMRDGYRVGGGFVWEGQSRACPDPAMTAALERLVLASTVTESFPATPPILPQATLFDTFAVLIGTLADPSSGGLVGGGAVLLLLGMSLAIDGVCAIGAWLSGAAIGGRLTVEEREELHRHNWVLEQFLWRFPEPKRRRTAARAGEEASGAEEDRLEQAFFIVPEGGDGQKTRDAKYFAYSFNLKLDAARQHVPISAIPAPFATFADRLRLASGGAGTFTVFPITSQSDYDALESHKRACAIALAAAPIKVKDYGDIDDKTWVQTMRKDMVARNDDLSDNIHKLRV